MAMVFFSYSHADSDLRDQLEQHLAMLKRQGRIEAWHDRKIVAGEPIDDRISEYLESADVILLLVSADFLASDYCYGIEMRRALERSNANEAKVVPIILRPCDWKSAPFARLLVAPTDGKPVTRWVDRDEAWLNVVEQLKRVLPPTSPDKKELKPVPGIRAPTARLETLNGPRSSNLRIRKEFSDADRARYLKQAFEFMARFFENSLEELQQRNSAIETEFTRVDAHRFTAMIFRNGKAVSQCEIRLNSRSAGFGAGITFSYDTSHHGNSFNESMTVDANEQSMFLKPLGLANFGFEKGHAHFSEEGAAEVFWGMLIERLQ